MVKGLGVSIETISEKHDWLWLWFEALLIDVHNVERRLDVEVENKREVERGRGAESTPTGTGPRRRITRTVRLC